MNNISYETPNETPNVKDIKKDIKPFIKGDEKSSIIAQKIMEDEAKYIKNRIQNKGALHNIWLRLGTCIWACIMLMGWLAFVAVLLWQIAFDKSATLSDNVLITLFTTTTINIVGLPHVVLKGLFAKDF